MFSDILSALDCETPHHACLRTFKQKIDKINLKGLKCRVEKFINLIKLSARLK